MPKGTDHVGAALEGITSAQAKIGQLENVEEQWKGEAVARLDATDALLRGTVDRFFVKTRVCLPFARKCQDAATTLDALLDNCNALPAPEAEHRLDPALEALEKAVRVLDERSLMQGMAIT